MSKSFVRVRSSMALAATTALLCLVGVSAVRAQALPGSAASQPVATANATRPALIPWPSSVTPVPGAPFVVGAGTVIEVPPGQRELRRLADVLSDFLWPALEKRLPVREAVVPGPGTIRLDVAPSAERSAESYELTVDVSGVRVLGNTTAGVFYGLQTLRQLLPWRLELRGVRPFAVSVPPVRIVDNPRFAWRGAMLDVARHFFTPGDVKRYIDLLVLYKINRLHLHLTDDQGWRIAIAKWPKLTEVGGKTEVKGGPGGFYTKKDYAEIVSYARDRYVTIVPEIDMPSHCNAALASYAKLNCDGKAPSAYTGIDVGFSNFCFDKKETYQFLDVVIKELAAMTPGPWLHIGGDEVKKMTPEQYGAFMQRAQALVVKHGKIPVGWDEIVHAPLQSTTVIHYWRPDSSMAPPPGTKLILSPANKMYLDMKYDSSTALGLEWAGRFDVDVPYAWDPAKHLQVDESQILGVEAPIWSETVDKIADVEFLLYPRLPAVAEVGWTAQASRDWNDFRVRLGAQAQRWTAMGVNAFWSPKIDWQR